MSLLARLIEAGTPADLVAEVAMELARAKVSQEAIETRRSADRERQARRRDNVTSRDTADVTADPALSRPPNENNSNPPTHTHPDVTTAPARKAGIFPMLDCTDAETWADFLTNRTKKRLPNTASAYRKLETDLAAMVARTGWPPGKVFAACVAKGWGAIYDPRDEENGPGNITHIRRSLPASADGRSNLARAIDEGLEWLG